MACSATARDSPQRAIEKSYRAALSPSLLRAKGTRVIRLDEGRGRACADDPRVESELGRRACRPSSTSRRRRRTLFARTGSRRTLALCGGLAALALLGGLLDGSAARAQEKPRDQACARWDELAREAIVHLVRGNDDGVLRQVSDAVWRMRRARRTCQLGWAQLACHGPLCQNRACNRSCGSRAGPDHGVGGVRHGRAGADDLRPTWQLIRPRTRPWGTSAAIPSPTTCSTVKLSFPSSVNHPMPA
jgi:hypothetical protein